MHEHRRFGDLFFRFCGRQPAEKSDMRCNTQRLGKLLTKHEVWPATYEHKFRPRATRSQMCEGADEHIEALWLTKAADGYDPLTRVAPGLERVFREFNAEVMQVNLMGNAGIKRRIFRREKAAIEIT